MKRLATFLRQLAKDILGQDTVEYAVFIGVITITAALSIPAVSDGIRAVFVNTQTILSEAAEGRDSGGNQDDDGDPGDQGDKGDCRNPNPGTHGGRKSMRSVEISKPAEVRGFGGSIPLLVSDSELGTALHNTAFNLALKTLPALAGFFTVVALFRQIQLLAPIDPWVHVATATAAAILVLIALAVHRRFVPARRANLAIALAANVALIHAFVELGVTRQVNATIYVIVLLPALASTILSWHCFLSVFGTALVGWGVLAALVMPTSEWELAKILGSALAASALASVVMHRFRLKAYRSRLNDELTLEKQTQTYQQVQHRYESAVRGANDGLWYWDLDANTLTVSARWLEMIGCNPDYHTVEPDFWFGKVDSYFLPALQGAISSHLDGKTEQIEYKYRIRTAAGAPVWVLTRGVASRDSEGRAISIAGSMTNIAHVIEVEQRLVRDALEDRLTGLANRHHLMSQLEALASGSTENDKPIALIFVDLDDFKLVNDSLGHPMGDRLLTEVAARLRQCQGHTDLLARYGGDEFVFLLENISSPDEPEGSLPEHSGDLDKAVSARTP